MEQWSERRWFFLACCLFLVCTFVFLYPYSFDPAHTVSDAGDPLLNISTLWRVQQHLAKGEIRDLYEANYFYPRKNVLAYSEIMLPTAIIAWPVAAISGNPVLAYNFSFLLAYFLTALFTFLLVRRLTGCPVAGIVSGLLFAFCQWRLNRPAHMQLLTNQWAPLTMLFLHKFWDSRRLRHIVIAAIFFAIQTISCIYLGLIFSVAVAIALAAIWLSHFHDDGEAAKPTAAGTPMKRKLLLAVRTGRPMLLFGGAAFGLLVGPLLPYFRLSPALEKARWGNEGADLLGYITVTKHDWLWRSFDLFAGRGELALFPGALAIALVCAGWVLRRRCSSALNSAAQVSERVAPRGFRALIVINRISLAIIGLVMIFRILAVNVRGINLGFIPLAWPVHIAILSWIAMIVARKLKTGRFMPGIDDREALYLVIAVAGLMLSLGAEIRVMYYSYGMGPFEVLASLLPPFGGMREIGRFGVLSLFGFFVLAGFATARMLRFVSSKWGERLRQRISWAVVIASVVSCFPLLPFPSYRASEASSEPAEYKWLSEQPGEKLIIEIPIHFWIDPEYMYYALFHGKNLVNGYSGWFPPEYDLIREVMTKCSPSRWAAVLLDEMGVDYIFFHPDRLSSDPYGQFPSTEPMLRNLERNGSADFSLVKRFKNCIVLQTKKAAQGLPRGPLLASRKPLFRGSFGEGADDKKAFDLRGQAEIPLKHSPKGGEITFSFDRPVSLGGVFADFHKHLENPYYCPFSVFVEDESGKSKEIPLTLELSLFEYRRKLYGRRFSHITEFTFPEIRTSKIRLVLCPDERNEPLRRLDLWGYGPLDSQSNEQDGPR
ncbi:MAG: hypothetical protein JW759_04415 [Candidatus Coatesbacteria bacterium]|nr:hypothetical protein [Candidatus Coatesbacteria bacterium]